MPGRIEKTVFISYREIDKPWAMAIYQYLTSQGYDVFFDYGNIDNVKFEDVITNNIKSHKHFLLILSPSTFERSGRSKRGDWLSRGIETAMNAKRNVVLLLVDGFRFDNSAISKKLTGNLASLKYCNGVIVFPNYFYEAMERLVQIYLAAEVSTITHPKSKPVRPLPTFAVKEIKSISRPLRVFLCHASQDKPAVRELYQYLVEIGIDAWLDEKKILPGQEWDLEIEKAIRSADSVVVFLSKNSISKEGYVQKELYSVLEMAREKPKGTIFIIPVRLDMCEVPEHLRLWQYVDFFPKDQKEWAFQRLQSSLRQRAESLKL